MGARYGDKLIMQEYERKYTRLTKCTDKNRSRLDPVKGMKVPAFQEKKNDVNGLEKLLRKEIVRCDNCGGSVIFKGRGRYTCERCKKDSYDDFGKVCLYLDTYGPATKYEIAAATGVPEHKVSQYLREKRLEISNINRGLE